MKTKEVQVDHMSFNVDHYAGFSEQDFIKEQLGSVPDRYGSDEKKKEFLVEAFGLIQKATPKEVASDKPGKAVGK